MGLIKNKGRALSWLEGYGFKYDSSPVAGDGTPGYEKGYYHSNDLEYLWVTVCFPKGKVYLYNEYECGGLLWERTLDIPEYICSTDEEKFIDWLDKELEIE